MVKHNIAIVEYKILSNILEEIKDNLSFSIINFSIIHILIFIHHI